jgi:hypothetical protein
LPGGTGNFSNPCLFDFNAPVMQYIYEKKRPPRR